MKLQHLYIGLAILAGLNAVFHLVEGNLIRAVLSGAVAVVFGLEASGRPTLGKVLKQLRKSARALYREIKRE